MTRAILILTATLALLPAAAHAQQAPEPGQSGPFVDVPTTHWAYDAVDEMRRRGILRGYPATKPTRPAANPKPKTPPQKSPARRRGPFTDVPRT